MKCFEYYESNPTHIISLSDPKFQSVLALILVFMIELCQRYIQTTILCPPSFAEKRHPAREESASFISKITFSYIDALIYKGYQKPLEEDDIWDLSECDKTSNIMRKYYPVRKRLVTFKRALWTAFFFRFAAVFSTTAISSILEFTTPYFLNNIILLLQKPSLEPADLQMGYTYLTILFVTSIIRYTLEGNVYFWAKRMAINLRSILISEIYSKALRRSADTGKKTEGQDIDEKASAGKIVSLMSRYLLTCLLACKIYGL